MVWYDAWLYVGWGVLALIVIGCLWLAFAMMIDSKMRSERNIAAPSLGASGSEGNMFANDDTVISSRKASRSKKKKDSHNKNRTGMHIEASDSAAIWGDDNDFSITNGQD